MKIAATPMVRKNYPSLLEIPAEPGFVDITIVLRSEWRPEFAHRFRQLRYVVVGNLEEADNLLRMIGYVDTENPSPDRHQRRSMRVRRVVRSADVTPA